MTSEYAPPTVAGFETLIDAKQFMQILCCTKSTFYAAIKAGIVPEPKKLLTKSLWNRSDVQTAMTKLNACTGVGKNWTPRKAGRPKGAKNKQKVAA